MSLWRSIVLTAFLSFALSPGGAGDAIAQTKPAGEMRWALYVTIAPAWLDPGEVIPGTITPFWILYALHDAMVKPMPGNPMAPSLAESWTESADHLTYEFTLRKGLKFHNGDAFTAEDVAYSFQRSKASLMHEQVKQVEVVDPTRIRFHLHRPWPDFMTTYGTLATATSWIVPKAYTEKAGPAGFKRHPIGLGPYRFVENNPGVELVLEAFEGYWRKVPSVKRMVLKSIPEASTRMAMLSRGEVDVAYLLDASLAKGLKNDPKLKLAFSGGIATYIVDFFDMWDPKSPWSDPRVRKAVSLAINRQEISEAETLGASPPAGNFVPKNFLFALPMEPDPYDPAKARQLLAEAGYPNGFDGGDIIPTPPYTSAAEAVANYLAAVGIKLRVRTMERAAFTTALGAKKLRGLCVCSYSVYGNASTRLSQIVPSSGPFAYGGFPDVDDMFRLQNEETDIVKRTAQLHDLQRVLRERTRFVPIFDYIWPSGIGPRVDNPQLMSIDPYPWAAPMEDVTLKTP